MQRMTPWEPRGAQSVLLDGSHARSVRGRVRPASENVGQQDNADNRSKRGQDPLRGPWRWPGPDPDTRLFRDIGDVAGTNRGAVEAAQARAVGYARPRPIRLSGGSCGLQRSSDGW